MKKPRLSNIVQHHVAEILTAIMMCKTMDDIYKLYDSLYYAYELCEDPFTHCPCSPKEYEKNKLEYERQTSIARYGYYDGPED